MNIQVCREKHCKHLCTENRERIRNLYGLYYCDILNGTDRYLKSIASCPEEELEVMYDEWIYQRNILDI